VGKTWRKGKEAKNAVPKCCTFALAREREWRQGKAKSNRGSQTSKHCNNIQNTALKAVRPVPLPFAYCLTKNKMRMKKIKWSTVRKVLQVIATIITTIAGTITVQSCMG